MEFTPEQKVLNDLFARDMTYIIPQYQRPYSWDCIGKSDKNNQVNMLWQDLIDFYESTNPNIYFMGSIVLIENEQKIREYEVVDGQQRLTTISLLLAAIKCFLQEIVSTDRIISVEKESIVPFLNNAIQTIDEIIFNQKKSIGLFIRPEKKVKIQSTIGFNYDVVLEEVLKCGEMTNIVMTEASEEQQEVTMRYFKNRTFFIERLKLMFLNKEGYLTSENANKIDAFFFFLMNKVSIVQIRTSKFDIAYQIFEILNNRGLPLSNKDLFRNFLISKFYELKAQDEVKYKDIVPNAKWKHLEDNYELNTEFISRYVESKRGGNQRYSAFNDLQEIYKHNFEPNLGKHKTILFYEDIEANLAAYTKILNAEFENQQMRNTLQFLLKVGNQRYVLNLLLSLFRKKATENQMLSFLAAFEKQTLYMLLSTLRFSSKPIYEAINHLNRGDISAAEAVFALKDAEIAELKTLFNKPIKDNDIAKLIIAKYYYSLDNLLSEDVVEQSLDFDKATLEHVIPQTPNPATNWFTDFDTTFRDEYTYKLGNMTLLTQKWNAAAKNYDFAKKRVVYAKTKLTMTTEIAVLSTIDKAFITQRHQKIVETIIKDLGI